MNSPYEDYYLEIIPYYNEDGMTPFSYIIPKSLEYFTATDGENDNDNDNDNDSKPDNSRNYIDLEKSLTPEEKLSQSPFRTDWMFLRDKDKLKETFNAYFDTEVFKQQYQTFIDSTPFETLFKKYVTEYPTTSCSANIFINYNKKFFSEISSENKTSFKNWWDNANKSEKEQDRGKNNFVLNILNGKDTHEVTDYLIDCFFSDVDAAKKVRKALLCDIQNYITNHQYTAETKALDYIKGFINLIEYDSDGLKSPSSCNCDESYSEDTKKAIVSFVESLKNGDGDIDPKSKSKESSSSTIWIIIAIVVVIIIIIVVVVIFMKKSKSKAVSVTPANAVPTYTALADAASAAGRAIAEAAPTE